MRPQEGGASFTISSLIPVSDTILGGIGPARPYKRLKAVRKFTVYNAYSANFGDIAVNMGKSRGFDIKHHIFVLKSFGSVRVIDALRVVDHISFYAVDQMYPVCLGRIGGIGNACTTP